jgi:hypothetical protein
MYRPWCTSLRMVLFVGKWKSVTRLYELTAAVFTGSHFLVMTNANIYPLYLVLIVPWFDLQILSQR